MGCCFSSEAAADATEVVAPPKKEAPTKHYSKPRWKSQEPLTAARLKAMREEYWDTQPHYGGDRVIWDAIKAACEATDMPTARLILDTAGVIVARPDMTILYDERGARYTLPNYMLSEPTNLLQGSDLEQQQVQMQPRQQQQEEQQRHALAQQPVTHL